MPKVNWPHVVAITMVLASAFTFMILSWAVVELVLSLAGAR